MQMKVRKISAVILLILATVLAVYFFTPHRIVIPEGEEIRVEYTVATLSVLEWTSTTGWETTEYYFSPGDEGYNELVEILESITYHNCIKTLSNSASASEIGYVIYIWVGDECYGFYDAGYVAVFNDARIFHRVAKKNVERIRGIAV